MSADRVALEEKITHLEATVDQLNGVVTELYDRVVRSEARVEQLQTRLAALLDQGANPAPDDSDPDQDLRDQQPPHW
ncbi:MAG: SlyX family protein [Planctomycetota bacterium]